MQFKGEWRNLGQGDSDQTSGNPDCDKLRSKTFDRKGDVAVMA